MDGFLFSRDCQSGKKLPLTAAAVHALRGQHTRTLAAETLKLECALSDLVNQAYGLNPEKIALMWQTAPPPHAHPTARIMTSARGTRPRARLGHDDCSVVMVASRTINLPSPITSRARE